MTGRMLGLMVATCLVASGWGAIGMAADAADLQSRLSRLVGTHRVLVVVARPGDPRVSVQHRLLDADPAALNERQVTIVDMVPQDARAASLQLDADDEEAFTVLLIGKDGGVKLRRHEPVTIALLTRTIDAMPMRRQEMRDH